MIPLRELCSSNFFDTKIIFLLIIRYCNISNWIAGLICFTPYYLKRCKIVKWVLKLCKCFERLNNFFGLLCFYNGLQNYSSARLSSTSNSLSVRYERIYKLCDPNNYFENLKHEISQNLQPIVPYILTFLTEIFQITESDNTQGYYINLDIVSEIVELMKDLRSYQKVNILSSQIQT